jgi:hypothetical protein
MAGEGGPPRTEKAGEVRCDCGALVARRVARGVELFCRRCKRVVWVLAEPAPRGGAR